MYHVRLNACFVPKARRQEHILSLTRLGGEDVGEAGWHSDVATVSRVMWYLQKMIAPTQTEVETRDRCGCAR